MTSSDKINENSLKQREQKIDSQKTALHLLLASENWSSDPISLKLAYAQWSKKLRDQLEKVS